MKILKATGLVIVGIIVGLLFSAISSGTSLGGVYNQTGQFFENSFIKVGSSGSKVTKVITGQVNCTAGTATITAGGRNTYDCAVTGVRSGDSIAVALGNPIAQLYVGGAYASTTVNDYFSLVLASASSTATVQVGTATTSVSYIVFDTE